MQHPYENLNVVSLVFFNCNFCSENQRIIRCEYENMEYIESLENWIFSSAGCQCPLSQESNINILNMQIYDYGFWM